MRSKQTILLFSTLRRQINMRGCLGRQIPLDAAGFWVFQCEVLADVRGPLKAQG